VSIPRYRGFFSKFLVEAVRAGEVSVEILPRDEKSLRSACEGLVRQVEGTPIVDQQRQSLMALEYVTDPVVIPCLVDAVNRHGWLAPIQALERMGGPQARAALVELSRGSDPAVVAQAKAALTRIR
jgi:hypothetical protein